MKLISMTDFVLEQEAINRQDNFYEETDKYFNKCVNYANFLKQPLNLGMFVPCVDNEVFNYSKHGNENEYQQAKERVLFEGFEVRDNKICCWNDYYGIDFEENKTIEDLIKMYDLILTPGAKNKIGL